MNRRSTRHFGERERAEFLGELEVFRQACIRVCTKAPIGSVEYRLADRLVGEILAAGERLTGDRDHFVKR